VSAAPAMIDTHVHIVSKDLHAYPLSPAGLPGAWYREAPHTAEELIDLMDACSVEKAVLVQPMGAYSFDNRYSADSARKHASRFVAACCIDVDANDPAAELRYWVRGRGMQGVRMFALSRGADSWLDDPRTYPLWEAASDFGAHVIVTILYHQLPQLKTVLEHFPDVSVSLDHCAFPPLAGPPWQAAEELFALAEHEKLHLKVSTHVLDSAAKTGRPADFVGALAARFGHDRLMWGSDFSQTYDRPYSELVRLGRAAFSELPEEAQAACLAGTARRLWPALAKE
jgi:L-fuconolactonase